MINMQYILWVTLEVDLSTRSGTAKNTMISGAGYWAIEKELGYVQIVPRG
jgi:hypothetical protein